MEQKSIAGAWAKKKLKGNLSPIQIKSIVSLLVHTLKDHHGERVSNRGTHANPAKKFNVSQWTISHIWAGMKKNQGPTNSPKSWSLEGFQRSFYS